MKPHTGHLMAPDSAGVAWAPGLPNYDHRITLRFVKTQGGMFKVPLWERINYKR